MNPLLRNLVRPIAFGALALFFSSCSTPMYTGQRAKKAQVARLKESKGFMSPYFVTLWEVNGVRVHDTTFGIDVPPGKVRVAVLLHGPPSRSNPAGYRKVHRTFTVKAGHVYTLDGAGGKLTIQEKVNRNFVEKLTKEKE